MPDSASTGFSFFIFNDCSVECEVDDASRGCGATGAVVGTAVTVTPGGSAKGCDWLEPSLAAADDWTPGWPELAALATTGVPREATPR